MPIEPSLVSSLTWFAHIARHRSFTKAATEMEVTRAALSQHLKGLEQHLNVRLLNRTTRRVTVTMDGAPEAGGRNLAPRPMEMMLAGAGGCTAYDVVLILKRSRQDVIDCTVSLKAERADTDPNLKAPIQVIQGGIDSDAHRGQMLPPIAHETTAMSGTLNKYAGIAHSCNYSVSTHEVHLIGICACHEFREQSSLIYHLGSIFLMSLRI